MQIVQGARVAAHGYCLRASAGACVRALVLGCTSTSLVVLECINDLDHHRLSFSTLPLNKQASELSHRASSGSPPAEHSGSQYVLEWLCLSACSHGRGLGSWSPHIGEVNLVLTRHQHKTFASRTFTSRTATSRNQPGYPEVQSWRQQAD